MHSGGGGEGGLTSSTPEPLEDPVLSSYAKCLAGDILCVWRRVGTPAPNSGGGGGGIFDIGFPPATTPPPLSLSAAKELWIFWYGEEPDLSSLVTPELFSSGECLYISSYPPLLAFHFGNYSRTSNISSAFFFSPTTELKHVVYVCSISRIT